jgi:hypothetical protein
MKMKSLRAWLRREPTPHRVQVRLEDGEWKDIAIPGDNRNRWKTVESSVLASDGIAVQLLDKQGAVLRGQELEREDSDDEEDTPEGKAFAAQGRNMREWTSMLQAVMHEQNTAFDKGKDAAAQSQDSLVELVNNMASHFATALTNIHNIVSNMAVMQQAHAEQVAKLTHRIAELSSDGSDHGSDMAGKLLVGMLAGGAGGAPAQKPMQPPPNSTKKG